MSKLVKRIKKNFKNPRNVLVLGTGFGYLSEICEHFGSVFIISTLEEPIKRKNLIYKETFDNIEFLPDLDVIFIDRNQDCNVEKLKPLLLRYRPILLVEGTSLFSKLEYKFLQNFSFSVTEMFNDYHLWKFTK
jgi:hypothetical protein